VGLLAASCMPRVLATEQPITSIHNVDFKLTPNGNSVYAVHKEKQCGLCKPYVALLAGHPLTPEKAAASIVVLHSLLLAS
jgi:hypothetical protein